MSSSHPASARLLSGRHVLLALIGFFAIVFATNGVMIYLAVSTFGGLDTADAYRKGLAYNERVAAAERQAKLGWRDEIAYLPETRRLRVSLSDSAGQALTSLAVRARVQRPATNRFDEELVLEQTGPGTYEVTAAHLAAGWWTVDVEAHRREADHEKTAHYEARRRLWIKP